MPPKPFKIFAILVSTLTLNLDDYQFALPILPTEQTAF